MPLLTNIDPTNTAHTVNVFANAYYDATARTLEFGARVYSSADAARTRALSHAIRENLNYLGAVSINASITNEFIASGVEADRARFGAAILNAAQDRAAADRADEGSSDDDNDSGPIERDGDAPAATPVNYPSL